jgi:hypothetical protein
MDETTTLMLAQRRLSLIWLAGAVCLIFLVLAQVLGGKWHDEVAKIDHSVDVIQWLFANVVPTSTLVLGVLAASELNPIIQREFKRQRRTRFFLRLTAGVCLFYLAVATAFPVMAVQRIGAQARFEALRYSGFVLPVLQGFVTIVLGAFFYKLESPEDAAADHIADRPVAPRPPVVAGH